MKIKWLGHAAFVITAEDGKRIMTDPYEPGAYGLGYGRIEDAADIVVVSHQQHEDHNYAKAVKGSPQLVTGSGSQKAKGIEFKGVASFHDDSGGKQRGPNTIFCFTVDGIRICHLGDLGHRLSDEQVSEVGQVDILLVPTGGGPTIDPAGATHVCEQIKPRVVIPMHYKTDKCAFPVSGVDEFLKGKSGVKRLDSSEAELKLEQLPQATEIMVLKHAL
ncbi:MAG: MBL fold metallo-hydrolase [Dehalococcoidia bacterium]|nr:MAG: MBL fold metallo-hydrolase [Dehalococcoidia bacterium]